mmetsp:Transcript_10230/g.18427  ORF Transcript_10230/g.18427 Transcript_10230/m.18427 type:complete len:212 (-) Transcript_10230:805-1440(-)
MIRLGVQVWSSGLKCIDSVVYNVGYRLTLSTSSIRSLHNTKDGHGHDPNYVAYGQQKSKEPENPKLTDGLHLLIQLDRHGAHVYETLLHGKHAKELKPHGQHFKFTHHSHNKRIDIHQHSTSVIPKDFLNSLEDTLKHAEAVILIGHGSGKASVVDALVHDLKERHPALLPKIVAKFSIDDKHSTPNELLKLAREFYAGQPDKRVSPPKEQ